MNHHVYHGCPNCGRILARPLRHCRGGQCPFCAYKQGAWEKSERERRKSKAERALDKAATMLRESGFSDEAIAAGVTKLEEIIKGTPLAN